MLPYRRLQSWPFPELDQFIGNDIIPLKGSSNVALNVKTGDKDYIAEIAVPGLTKEDVKVHLNDNDELVVSVEKKEEKREGGEDRRYIRREFSSAKFVQTLILPDDVNKVEISAKVENGVLTISLPKKVEVPAEKTERTIEVN